MFRCQLSRQVSMPREKQFTLVTERRPVTYYKRAKKGEFLRDEEGNRYEAQGGEFLLDEFGNKIPEGYGWEVAKELKVSEASYYKYLSENSEA